MTIEVEDGTAKANAQSYISVADATTYHAARGNDSWAEQDAPVQEQALIRAASALDSWLRGQWLGTKKTQAQALAWPRTGVVDQDSFEIPDTTIPTELKQACAEVALIELTERFIQQSVSRDHTVSSTSVGPVAVSYRADAPTNKRYPHIEAMLRGIANTAGTQIGMNVYLTQDEIDELSGVDAYDLGDYVIKSY